MDPYQSGLVPEFIYETKSPVKGQITAVMNASLDNRKLKLINEKTRAFRKYDQVEIIGTTEYKEPGEEVNLIAYFGFIEIKQGGVVRRDDRFYVGDRLIGKVLGFDATHTPNHYNLLIHVDALKTGYEHALQLGDAVRFVYK